MTDDEDDEELGYQAVFWITSAAGHSLRWYASGSWSAHGEFLTDREAEIARRLVREGRLVVGGSLGDFSVVDSTDP